MGCGASAAKNSLDAKGVLPSGRKGSEVEVVKSQSTKSTTGFSGANLVTLKHGKVSDYYDMEKNKIGAGGFGSVCRAKHKATSTMRAIKMINKAKMHRHVQKEIDINRALDHPNICKLFEVFDDRRYIYLVMELCIGGELFDRLEEVGTLKEAQAAVLMQSMFRSLHYMHTCNYIHRDLKPENFIFTTKESIENSTLKLIDFGFAREFRHGQVLTTKVGSPYYLAPEVLSGRYVQSVDMWSLGVIMYLILCGYPPFNGQTEVQIVDAVREGKLVFHPEEWANISEDAQRLIRNLLMKDPEKRYTAEKALHDVWTQKLAPAAKDIDLHQTGVMDRLRGFRSHNKLRKAALHAVASILDDKQISALRDVFTKLDGNGDGTLTAAELKEGITASGVKEFPPDFDETIKAMDSDGSGRIDYSEFLASTLEQRLAQQEDVCWQAFCVFDHNGNGTICRKELSKVLADGDVKGTFGKDVDDIIAEADLNGDDEIDFKEFMVLMRK
eukprot:TRINITY_DN47938_c0_g1_i1.p1 TRINITY_DN47938_c0_g1~~TRINITY_DN47938_c0_g1_i1.p1  ORF type:complete len:499 (-),score=106.17 TRINITY_DN47938_c0_g1_i1:89-1585(-)